MSEMSDLSTAEQHQTENQAQLAQLENPQITDLQAQINQLTTELAEKLDRVGRSGTGGKSRQTQAARRIGGVTLPPIEKSGKATQSRTPPPTSALGTDDTNDDSLGSTWSATPILGAQSDAKRRERLIKKGIFEAQDIMNTAERIQLTTTSPTKLGKSERQYGDALAALQYSNSNGELNNALRAKEIELAHLTIEHTAVERGYSIAKRKFEAMKERQETIAQLSDAHSAKMATLRRQEKEVQKRLRESETELSSNHRTIEDLNVQMQRLNQKLPKAEIEVLTKIFELKQAFQDLGSDNDELSLEMETALASRRRQVENLTREIAMFDESTYVKRYWEEVTSRSARVSPLAHSQPLCAQEEKCNTNQ